MRKLNIWQYGAWMLALSILLGVAGCQQTPAPVTNSTADAPTPAPAATGSTAQPANAQWDAFITEFLDSYFTAHPDTAVYAGRHEFDGKLPDWSATGLQNEIARLKTMRDRANGYKDDTLDERQRFEREYVAAQINKDLYWLETADWPHRNPYYYADSIDPDVYVSRPYATPDVRLKAYTAYALNVPNALAQIKANLKTPLPKPYIAIGRQTIGGLSDFYAKDVPKVFGVVKDATAQKDFKTANDGAIKAVKDFDAWLAEQEKTATNDFALGADKFATMVKQTEGVDVPLAQLEEIANRDLQRNLGALTEACLKFAPGQDVNACLVKANAHKPAGSVVAGATQQLTQLRKFIVDKDLLTIPGTEEAKVAEAPPYKRWNFAYINIPGPYEKGLPSVYYVSPPDPTWSKAKQAEYVPGVGSLLFTSAHEVWPGHFLQFLHANRASSKFGQVFVGYAFAEGWAHYTEEMMWDAGLGDNAPEMHIGQLQEALLRNVRFISAIGLHTHGMSVEDSVKMFKEKGFQDEGNAEQQARRGTFDPAYINYTMGKLMIRKLREDWTAAHGGRAAWKEFHDKFLSYGGPPIPLVRKAMMGASDKGTLF